MLLVLAAALLKLSDVSAFEVSLRTWALLPTVAIPWLAVGVPAVELLVTGMWFLGVHRSAAATACLCMVLCFSAVFVLHLLVAEPPDCGRLGLLSRYQSQEAAATSLLLRDFALFSATVAGMFLRARERSPGTQRPGSRESLVSGMRPGFTLIELILVMALLAILVSLLLPTLDHARRTAQRLDPIADLRSHMQALNTYSIDYDDQWPFLTDPDATYTIFRHPSGRAGPIVFFGVTNMWHWPLLDGYYAEGGADVFVAAGDRTEFGDRLDGVFSSYDYSATMYSRPEFWNLATRTGPDQWRPVRVSDVRFPSQKGGLYYDESEVESSGVWVRLRRPIGFCDGSAVSVRYEDITRPYPKGDGHWWGSFDGFGIRVRHTMDGAYGRDIE